jgi:hypothetical protein
LSSGKAEESTRTHSGTQGDDNAGRRKKDKADVQIIAEQFLRVGIIAGLPVRHIFYMNPKLNVECLSGFK